MKTKILILFIMSAIGNLYSLQSPEPTLPPIKKKTGISFTENKGQVHDQNHQPRTDVLYAAMTGEMSVHIKRTGISYQLYQQEKSNDSPYKNSPFQNKDAVIAKKYNLCSAPFTIYRVDLNWLHANKNFTTHEDQVLPGYSNYYLQSCPLGALNVKSYSGVVLKNLYDGINLHYYEKNNELKHDYIVAPHADYKQIKVLVDGADINVKSDGSLIMTTPLGKIQEGAPVVYQNNIQLKARWVLTRIEDATCLSFQVDNYKSEFELIIDPVTRLWGTFYGGTGTESASSCDTDASGNVYIAGQTDTQAGTAIATSGGHQFIFNGAGGLSDAFLAKFNSNGVRQWATYYGGNSHDFATGCATDNSGNVYMSGSTTSTGTVISSAGSHQVSFGGSRDGFLVKFNANGVRVWGTFYGGSDAEDGNCCATDALGNVYLTGRSSTDSGTDIATTGSHQFAKNDGYDAYLVKFDANGVRQWGTFYGGTGDLDEGMGCATDQAGNVYITGITNTPSGNFIATPGCHQISLGGNAVDIDAFLVKFNANGIRQWGTFYGGIRLDLGAACATDANGNVYMVGATSSSVGAVIATPGSHQPVYGGGTQGGVNDGFLVKFNSTGNRQWATYYGGTGMDLAMDCAVDGANNVYLTGSTSSSQGSVVTSTGCHQPQLGGETDAFLAKFNSNGIRQGATYYGGAGFEDGYGCAADAFGNIYMTGHSFNGTGMVFATVGSHQSTFGGWMDAFLVNFGCTPPQPPLINGDTLICNNFAHTFSVQALEGVTYYSWTFPLGWTGSGTTNTIMALPGNSGIISIVANNECGSSLQQDLNVVVTSCTGFNETAEMMSGIKLYPNPATERLRVELDSSADITFTNALGQIVYASGFNSGSHQISFGSMADGLYIVTIRSQKKNTSIKLIKN